MLYPENQQRRGRLQRLCPGSLLLINLLPVAGMFMDITPAFRAVSPPVNSKFRHKTVIFIIFHQNDQKHGKNFIVFIAIFRVARRGKYGIIYNMNNELLCTFRRCNYG